MENKKTKVPESTGNQNNQKNLYRMLYESAFGVFIWFFIPFNLLLIWSEPFQVKQNRAVIQERLTQVNRSLHNLNFQMGGMNAFEREKIRSNDLKRKNCYQRIIASGWKASSSACLNSTGEDFKRNETLEDYRYWHSPGYYLKRFFWLLMPLYLYLLNHLFFKGPSQQKEGAAKPLRSWIFPKYKRPLLRKIRRA